VAPPLITLFFIIKSEDLKKMIKINQFLSF